MKRALLTLLTTLFLVSSLPASVGTHPLLGGDAGTGGDAPDSPEEAWAIEEGEVQGDLLPPLDRADWYRFEVLEASRLGIDSWSDTGVKMVLISPENETITTGSIALDNTTGTWYIGVYAQVTLPAHYGFVVKTAPAGEDPHCDRSHDCHPCHHTCPREDAEPLPDSGANGTITHEDPVDYYTLSAAAFELVTFFLDAEHGSGIDVRVYLSGDVHMQRGDHDDGGLGDPFVRPQHEVHHELYGHGAQWFAPFAADLLVEVRLVHDTYKVCDPSGCTVYEQIGKGGDYTLTLAREPDVPQPDLAVMAIKEVRRAIRTDLTPDVPNVVNERRTVVVDVANLGEGDARWGGFAFLEIVKRNGPFWSAKGEAQHLQPLAPGGSTSLEFDWDTTLDIGDYEIIAHVQSFPGWFDADHGNDQKDHETFVKVGGLL